VKIRCKSCQSYMHLKYVERTPLMAPRSSDMIAPYANHIWLDQAGDLVKSEVKVPAAAHEGEAGFASDCTAFDLVSKNLSLECSLQA
jgi:hypothetical protein